MKTITIYVSRNGNSKNVKLRDSLGNNPGNNKLKTHVDPNDTIIWKIDPKEYNLFSLTGIKRKPSSGSILLKNPPLQQKDGSFKAEVISATNMGGRVEIYDVSFQIEAGGPVLTSDPKLKMKPRTLSNIIKPNNSVVKPRTNQVKPKNR